MIIVIIVSLGFQILFDLLIVFEKKIISCWFLGAFGKKLRNIPSSNVPQTIANAYLNPITLYLLQNP